MRGRSVTDAALDSCMLPKGTKSSLHHSHHHIAAGATSDANATLFHSPAAEESYMRVSVIVLAASFFFNFAMVRQIRRGTAEHVAACHCARAEGERPLRSAVQSPG